MLFNVAAEADTAVVKLMSVLDEHFSGLSAGLTGTGDGNVHVSPSSPRCVRRIV
jgi:hypothetical protein